MKMNLWTVSLTFILVIVSSSSAKRFVLKNTNDKEYNNALAVSKRTVAIVQDSRGGWMLSGTCQSCSIGLTQGCTVCTMIACQKTIPWSSLVCQGLNAKTIEKLRLAKTGSDVPISYNQGKTAIVLNFRVEN